MVTSQSLEIASLPNLRDVGGHPTRAGGRVRTGLLYRSSDLSRLDGADAAAFARLGIRSVYDLRTEDERAAQPDRLPPGTEHIAVDVIRDSSDACPTQLRGLLADPKTAGEVFGGGGAAGMWTRKYREFVSLGSARCGYGRLFGDLAAGERLPALLHCATGKDRTGWACAALLLLLDVTDDLVMDDYLLSGVRLQPLFQPWLDEFQARGGDPELLQPLMSVRREYLEAALDEMTCTFGTIDDYFADGLGLGADARRALRTIFVGDANFKMESA